MRQSAETILPNLAKELPKQKKLEVTSDVINELVTKKEASKF